MAAELWLPPSSSVAKFKKSPPPKLGEKFGVWSGPNTQLLTLPGGGILQFDLSKLTLADYRNMRDHYQINVSLSVLTFMMQRLDWHIECTDKKIASFVEDNLKEVWTRLIRAMGQAYWSGFSPIAIQWENDLDERRIVATKFKDLIPEECVVNWKTVDGYAPPNTAKPKIPIYDGIVQTRYGQYGSGTHLEGIPLGMRSHIPTENTLWYPLLMENGDYYGRKILRPAFPSWFFSILIHLFHNRYLERFGEPTPVGRADYEDQVEIDGKTVSGRTAMESVLSALRNRSVVVLPSSRDPETKEYDYSIEYLESQMRGADFERYLDRLDEEMSIGIFTPTLLFRTSDVGSYNLGVTHMQLFMWMLNALAADLKEYIDKFVVNRLKEFNFGERAPKAYWVPRPMGKENVETVRAIITEILRTGKAKANLQDLSDLIGIEFQPDKPDPPMVAVDPNTGEVPPPPPVAPPIGGKTGPQDKRPPRDRPKAKPRTVQKPKSTGKQIAARLLEQAHKAYTRGDKFYPILGHRKQFEEALVAEGMEVDDAAAFARDCYHKLETWLHEAVPVYSTAESLVEAFELVLDGELESLATQD